MNEITNLLPVYEGWSPALSVTSVVLSILSMLSSCADKVCHLKVTEFNLNVLPSNVHLIMIHILRTLLGKVLKTRSM